MTAIATHPDRQPVIVGVGELSDRPARLDDAREPAELMAEALRVAQADAGAPLLAAVQRLDVINEISWPYADPGREMALRLGRPGLATVSHPVGGQTPLLALHEAALRITEGAIEVAAVCGAEAQGSVNAARKAAFALPWSPPDADARPIRGGDHQSAQMRALDLATPSHVYPFYEAATRAAWGMTLEEAQAESGQIWAANAAVAKGRDAAWIRRDVGAADIVDPSPENRLIAWPYTKLMVANPMVNQGAAVILCSVARADALGVPQEKRIHLWAGSAADEPRDLLKRDTYDRSRAMEAVLGDALQALRATGRSRFDHLELYSCFPCVPKMARRTLGVGADQPLSVAGGLTFFGAPLNNYMTHAAVAMVERLRAEPAAVGLLYGQGEYVTKHHALVLGAGGPPAPLRPDYRHADLERELAQAAPPAAPDYAGPCEIETCTVLFDREARVRHGAVIARTPDGARLVARVPPTDAAAIDHLLGRGGVEPVGSRGVLRPAADGLAEWRPTDGDAGRTPPSG